MKIINWLNIATKKLSKSYNPQKEAEIFLEFVVKKSNSWIKIFSDYKLNNNQLKILNHLIKRRVYNQEPIAYILKECYFWSFKLFISKISMIPRIESEILVEETLKYIDKFNLSNVLELGCGCGAISLALAKEKPKCFFLGIDYSINLIKLSKYNAKKLNIKNAIFKRSNWFSKIKNKKFDIIISNPPYIDTCDPHIFIGDLRFEPINALLSEENGLYYIKLIANQSKNFLTNKGYIIFEHGWNQYKKVYKILKSNNFVNIFKKKDYSNCDRITGGMFLKK